MRTGYKISLLLLFATICFGFVALDSGDMQIPFGVLSFLSAIGSLMAVFITSSD